MPLRSGKNYLISHKCLTANCPFWGSDKTGSKCSYCFHNTKSKCDKNGKPIPLFELDDTFRIKLEDWVNQNTIPSYMEDFIYRRASTASPGTYWIRIHFLFQYLKEDNLWITAKFAQKILGRTSNNYSLPYEARTHMVCSRILDWWHIREKNGFQKWELCYYGRFEEITTYPKTVPPLPYQTPNPCVIDMPNY